VVPVIDINTRDITVDGAPPGRTFQPTRYTTTRRDEIRVGLWELLSTIQGTYRMGVSQGLDIEEILSPSTSDAERSALVAEVVLGYPGVTGILAGPVVAFDGTTYAITVTANTVDGPVAVAA
jgi:hypothetical protein